MLGYRGTCELVVSFKDREATKRIKAIADQAQWFEDHSPIQPEHRKKDMVGITTKVITVVAEAGDDDAIGINLPNAPWIRKEHGSKLMSLGNIADAYERARNSTRLRLRLNRGLLSVSSLLYYQPAVARPAADYRLNNATVLAIKLYQQLALNLAYKHSFESVVVQSRSRANSTLSIGFAYSSGK